MRIRYRFLFSVLLVVAVFATAAFALHRYQVGGTASTLISLAETSAEEGDVREARRFYGRYLGLRPDDNAARAQFGILLADIGEYERSFYELERALRSDESLTDARVRLVEVALSNGRFNDAKTQLENHLLVEDPSNPEYLWMLGNCKRGLGNESDALGLFEKAVNTSPADYRFAASLATILRSESFDQHERAREVLDDLVEKAPSDPHAFAVRSQWCIQRSIAMPSDPPGERDAMRAQAWNDAKNAIEFGSDDPVIARFAATLAINTGHHEEVRDHLVKSIESNPDLDSTAPLLLTDLYILAANIEQTCNNAPKARELLLSGLNALPSNKKLLLQLAQLELSEGNTERVQQLISDIGKDAETFGQVSLLESQLLVIDGEWGAAAEKLKSSRKFFVHDPSKAVSAELLLAECLKRDGNQGEQIAALRRAVKLTPQSTVPREALALALLDADRRPEAMIEFSLVARQPEASLRSLIIVAQHEFSKALKANKANPDWTRVNQILEKSEKSHGPSTEFTILSAKMLIAEGKTKEAEEFLSSAVESDPDDLSLRLVQIDLAMQNEKWDDANDFLDDTETTIGESPTTRSARAKLLVQRDRKEVSMDKLDELATVPGDWNEAQTFAIASGFARFFYALEEFERSQIQAEIAAQTPLGKTNPDSMMLLFDLAHQSGDTEKMAKWLKQVEDIEGQGATWHFGKAISLAFDAEQLSEDQSANRDKLLAEAIHHVEEARILRPKWYKIPYLHSTLLARQGDSAGEADKRIEAIELGYWESEFVVDTVEMLRRQKRDAEANALTIGLFQQDRPISQDLIKTVAQNSVQLESSDGTFEQVKDYVKDKVSDSASQSDLLFLAQICGMDGSTKESDRYHRQAIELDPSAPAPWVSLVQLHAKAGDLESAKTVIEEAILEINPDDSDLALAQAYVSVNDLENAEKHYRSAVKSNPDDSKLLLGLARLFLATNQQAKAIPVLEEILSDGDDIEQRDRLQARRSLAVLISAQGGPDALKRARDLISQNEAENEASPSIDDQRTLAQILGGQNDNKLVRQAIAILVDITEGSAAFSLNDNYLLASLYAKLSDWTRFTPVMDDAISNGGGEDPRYVYLYANSLLAQGMIREARSWTDKLRSLTGDDIGADITESKLLFAEGSEKGNYEVLLQFLSGKSATEDRIGWVAGSSESFAVSLSDSGETEAAGQFDALAEKCFLQISETSEQTPFAASGYYARRGDAKNALAHAPDATPDQLLAVSQLALTGGKLNADQAGALIDAISSIPNEALHPAIKNMLLGDLYSWKGDWQNAIKAYQLVLSTEKNSVAAWNNLAFILALKKKRLDIAEKALEQAFAAASPQMRDALYDTRGIVRMALGQARAAENDFRMSLELAVAADRLLHLADSQLAQGQKKEASEQFKLALDRGLKRTTLHPMERHIFDKLKQAVGQPSDESAATSESVQ